MCGAPKRCRGAIVPHNLSRGSWSVLAVSDISAAHLGPAAQRACSIRAAARACEQGPRRVQTVRFCHPRPPPSKSCWIRGARATTLGPTRLDPRTHADGQLRARRNNLSQSLPTCGGRVCVCPVVIFPPVVGQISFPVGLAARCPPGRRAVGAAGLDPVVLAPCPKDGFRRTCLPAHRRPCVRGTGNRPCRLRCAVRALREEVGSHRRDKGPCQYRPDDRQDEVPTRRQHPSQHDAQRSSGDAQLAC